MEEPHNEHDLSYQFEIEVSTSPGDDEHEQLAFCSPPEETEQEDDFSESLVYLLTPESTLIEEEDVPSPLSPSSSVATATSTSIPVSTIKWAPTATVRDSKQEGASSTCLQKKRSQDNNEGDSKRKNLRLEEEKGNDADDDDVVYVGEYRPRPRSTPQRGHSFPTTLAPVRYQFHPSCYYGYSPQYTNG
jgi:hypothetical protein